MRACDPLFLILICGRNALRTCPLCWLSGSPRVLTALWGREWRDSNPDRQEGNLEVGRNVVTPAFGCSWFCPGGSYMISRSSPSSPNTSVLYDLPWPGTKQWDAKVSGELRQRLHWNLPGALEPGTGQLSVIFFFFYIFCLKGSGIFSS